MQSRQLQAASGKKKSSCSVSLLYLREGWAQRYYSAFLFLIPYSSTSLEEENIDESEVDLNLALTLMSHLWARF